MFAISSGDVQRLPIAGSQARRNMAGFPLPKSVKWDWYAVSWIDFAEGPAVDSLGKLCFVNCGTAAGSYSFHRFDAGIDSKACSK
jgi:hypothetical protein